MLVEEMTVAEINNAVYRDFNIIRKSTTQNRLEKQYFEYRNIHKIDKSLVYPVFTTIKSHSKNNWLLMTLKDHESESVKSLNDIVTAYYTYYHNHKGYRVFNPCTDYTLMAYNGHMFSRYRERMNLSITDPIEVIKHFFSNNCSQPIVRKFDKNDIGDIPFISVEKEGYLMGDIIQYSDKITWHVFKTFIPHSTARLKHTETSDEVKLLAAKELLNLKLGVIKELDEASKRFCDVSGLMDKEVTISFLEHLIEDLENNRE